MKTILLSLLMMTPAFAATQTLDVTVQPVRSDKGVCTYDANLPFATFPDFSVFLKMPKGNVWNQGDNLLRSTVEQLEDGSYRLHLQPMPEFPEGAEVCPAKIVKVLVR
jgi:hypothetical protein